MKPPRSILDKGFVYTPARVQQGDPTYLLRKFRKMQKESRKSLASNVVQTLPKRKQHG